MTSNATPPAEQRYVLGIAWKAGRDDRIAKGVDGHKDFMTEAEVEKAAWYFGQSDRHVGIHHADGTLGHAAVVESYIWRGPDWDLGDGVVVRKGDWLLGAILDEASWGLYKTGRVTGWSPQGVAKRRTRRSEP